MTQNLRKIVQVTTVDFSLENSCEMWIIFCFGAKNVQIRHDRFLVWWYILYHFSCRKVMQYAWWCIDKFPFSSLFTYTRKAFSFHPHTTSPTVWIQQIERKGLNNRISSHHHPPPKNWYKNIVDMHARKIGQKVGIKISRCVETKIEGKFYPILHFFIVHLPKKWVGKWKQKKSYSHTAYCLKMTQNTRLAQKEKRRLFGDFPNTVPSLERMRIFPAQDKCNFLCGISLFLSKNRGGQKPRTLLMVGTHLAVFLLLTLSYEWNHLTNRVVNQNKYKGSWFTCYALRTGWVVNFQSRTMCKRLQDIRTSTKVWFRMVAAT